MIEHAEIWSAIVGLGLLYFEFRLKIIRRIDRLEKKIDELLEVVYIEKTARIKKCRLYDKNASGK